MNSIKTILFLSLSLLSGSIFAETIYNCPTANGSHEYTATSRPDCTPVEMGSINTYQSNTPSSPSYDYSSSNSSSQAPQNDARRQQALAELREAEKKLEEGKNVRLGGERNYAKYQERIQKLEDDVQKARLKVERRQY